MKNKPQIFLWSVAVLCLLLCACRHGTDKPTTAPQTPEMLTVTAAPAEKATSQPSGPLATRPSAQETPLATVSALAPTPTPKSTKAPSAFTERPEATLEPTPVPKQTQTPSDEATQTPDNGADSLPDMPIG